MATRKTGQNTGPVKPPVLDVKARSEGTGQKAEATKATPKKPEAPQRKLPLLPFATAIVGVFGGFALAYGVATIGFWPQKAPPPSTTAADISALTQRIAAIETAQSDFTAKQDTANDELRKNIAASQTQLDDIGTTTKSLSNDLAALKATPAPPTVDESALDALKSELADRIDAISTGASPEVAEQLAQKLATSEQALANLTARLAAIETAQAQQKAQTPPAPAQDAQLPLALSGLEAALSNGRPFEAELLTITQSLPDLTLPADLMETAKAGLATPNTIADAFDKSIPNLLAAIPAKPNASWQERAFEQARGLLALRPVGDVSGDSPEAKIARLEAAIAEPDFAKAKTISATMPQDMRARIPTILNDIAAQATAAEFIARARQYARPPSTEQSGATAQ